MAASRGACSAGVPEARKTRSTQTCLSWRTESGAPARQVKHGVQRVCLYRKSDSSTLLRRRLLLFPRGNSSASAGAVSLFLDSAEDRHFPLDKVDFTLVLHGTPDLKKGARQTAFSCTTCSGLNCISCAASSHHFTLSSRDWHVLRVCQARSASDRLTLLFSGVTAILSNTPS